MHPDEVPLQSKTMEGYNEALFHKSVAISICLSATAVSLWS